jgi:hypothetical protein
MIEIQGKENKDHIELDMLELAVACIKNHMQEMYQIL